MTKPALAGALFVLGTIGVDGQVPGFTTNSYEVFTMPSNSFPSHISNNGVILASGFGSGYLVKKTITPLTIPAADVGLVFPNGMNEGGDIVGEYRDAGNFAVPFAIINNSFQLLMQPDGRTLFPSDINQRRVIVGSARRAAERQVGFILENGNYTFVECPGLNGAPEETVFSAINNDGAIAGWCIAASKFRGFLYRKGDFSFFQYPGSDTTRIFDVNKNGDLVGDARVQDADGQKVIAFLYRNGAFYDVSFPGTRQGLARAINDLGDVLGSATIVYREANGDFLGLGQFNFVRGTKELK